MCQLISDGGLLGSGPLSGKRQVCAPRQRGRRTEQGADDQQMIVAVGASLHVVNQQWPGERNQAGQNVRKSEADRGSFDTCRGV